MLYKNIALIGSAIFIVTSICAQDIQTNSSANNANNANQQSKSAENNSGQSSSGNNESSSPSPKPQTPQQVNAEGQDALNGTTARKDQLEQEKLKVQSEKYQAEINQDKQSQQSNAKGSQALNSSSSQSVGSSGNQSQQNSQIQAAEQTKDIMPQPTLMQAESNQDQAENMQNEQNKQQFYDPQANQ